MIERHLPSSLLGVHQNKFFCSAPQIIAIPETTILREPMRRDLRLVHSFDAPTKAAKSAAALLLVYGGRFIRGDAFGWRWAEQCGFAPRQFFNLLRANHGREHRQP